MTSKYFTCPKCHENTPFKSMATDRVELERDKGEKLRVACNHCYEQMTVHVNDIKAAPNKVIAGVGVAAGVAATAAFWHLGFVAWIAGALPVIVYGAQRKAADTFNSYSIRRSE
jgi:hypothetical protein